MSNELKPCPFCGTSDLLGFEPSHEGGWTVVKCRRCGGSGSTGRSESEQEATAWWNRRAQPAEADGVEVVAWRCEASKPGVKTQVRLVFTWPEAESFAHHYEDRGCKVTTTALVEKAKHRAALSAVTAERDRLQRNLDFTELWYATRFERLADLGKSAGCWDAMAAIIANGTVDSYETPTYAQQLVRANHRADVAERERDQLRAELRKAPPEWAKMDPVFVVEHIRHATAFDADKVEAMLDFAIGAAMAAKEGGQ